MSPADPSAAGSGEPASLASLPFADGDAELKAYLDLIGERITHLQAMVQDAGADLTASHEVTVCECGKALSARASEIQKRSAATVRAGIVTPLSRLKSSFGLSPIDLEILVAAVAPERSSVFRRRYMALWPETNVQPEVAFYARLLADSERSEHDVRYAFDSDAPLLAGRLVELTSSGTWLPEAPLLYRRVRVVERVLSFIEGREAPPPRLLGEARFTANPRSARDLVLDEAMRAQVARAMGLDEALPLLHGLNGIGKKTLIETVAADLKRPLLSLDLTTLPVDILQARARLMEILREARLQGAVLIVEHVEVADDERRPGLAAELGRLLATVGVPRAITAVRLPRWVPLSPLPAVIFELAPPTLEHQLALWTRLLPTELRLGEGMDLDGLVKRYSLVPGSIEESCVELRRADAVYARGGVIDEDALVQAVRSRLVHRLGTLAAPVSTTLSWSDLVLPDDVINRLLEFLSYARQRDRVLGRWGFGKKLAYGGGLSALFSGPPGTGKTMVATLLAKELGLELYRMNLAQVVNKYIGETEKNLGQLFDEARHGQVVLLFDEADSLFAKRTEVRSSHDRYANLEVNYLLQRMEHFDGVMILTTNAETAIDPAFRRRIRFRLRFPMPNDEQRADLWRAMIPAEAELDADIDFRSLAKRYPLVGGSIKNAVVRAAVAALEEESSIRQSHLVLAAALEYEEMGFLSQRAPDDT